MWKRFITSVLTVTLMILAPFGSSRSFAPKAAAGAEVSQFPLLSAAWPGELQATGSPYGVIDQPGIAGGPFPADIPSSVPKPDIDGGSDPACWKWQVLPKGLLYPAYLAGITESRLGTQLIYVDGHGWFCDATLGGHVGLLRYGSDGSNDDGLPQGWQLDVEGAAFPRLDLETARELRSADFRVGVPLTFRRDWWETKFAYYHLCGHLGDSFVLENPGFPRITYIRDGLVYGVGLRPWRDVRFYGEVGYGFHTEGMAQPWELQFGSEYSPTEPTGLRGSPFVAINSHLRQDNDFSGNVSLQTGWQWRDESGHLARVGMHYFNGLSEQYQFFNRHENQVGLGLWYDF